MLNLVVAAVAASSCWLLLLKLIPQLRTRLLDQPNDRSSHFQPTPRGGGIAFVALTSVFSAILLISGQELTTAALPLLASPLAVVGLLDDRHNLPSTWRFGVQFLTAVVILGVSPLVQRFALVAASSSLLPLFSFVLLAFAVTAIINFTNFMDGLDGLVAGCMLVAISALSFELSVSSSTWALVGSLFGFLLWNWSPAKVFMGDTGSTFLGAVFAGLVLQASSWLEAFSCLLVATPLFTDACFCLFRRLLAGQPVFEAHRLHLFQRLNQAGWSHARVSLTYVAATSVLSVALLIGGWPCVLGFAVAEVLVGFWLDKHVALPFFLASQNK